MFAIETRIQSLSPSVTITQDNKTTKIDLLDIKAKLASAIVTNAHVAELLCQGPRCTAVRVERPAPKGRFESALSADLVDLRVRSVFPALDIAILELPQNLRSPFSLNFSKVPVREELPVTMIGYPGCGARAENAGSISDLTSLSFLSGARGASGSSGSPILDSEGAVIGIAFQADSLLRALYDRFGRGSFRLRAVRTDALTGLSALSAERLRGAEAELLLRFYSSDVSSMVGLARIKRALLFFNGVRMLANTTTLESTTPELVRGAALVDRAPDFILQLSAPPPTTPAGKAMELVAFVANLEARGFVGGSFNPLTQGTFSSVLLAQGRAPEDVQRFLSFLPSPDTQAVPGILPLLALLGVAGAAVIGLVATLWAASFGYVYARCTGGRIRRLAHALTVALVLWPISFLAYRFYLLRRPTASVPHKANR
ncbi:MAG: serine protease [Proteobacteria bacterium]|nr:serine protease [Pseudomonadota bacterium]